MTERVKMSDAEALQLALSVIGKVYANVHPTFVIKTMIEDLYVVLKEQGKI